MKAILAILLFMGVSLALQIQVIPTQTPPFQMGQLTTFKINLYCASPETYYSEGDWVDMQTFLNTTQGGQLLKTDHFLYQSGCAKTTAFSFLAPASTDFNITVEHKRSLDPLFAQSQTFSFSISQPLQESLHDIASNSTGGAATGPKPMSMWFWFGAVLVVVGVLAGLYTGNWKVALLLFFMGLLMVGASAVGLI